jgi:hypothetical protein
MIQVTMREDDEASSVETAPAQTTPRQSDAWIFLALGIMAIGEIWLLLHWLVD